MVVISPGDVMIFECKTCGCMFKEATKNTDFKNCAVYDREKKECGTWMPCPECGSRDVLGFRRKNHGTE